MVEHHEREQRGYGREQDREGEADPEHGEQTVMAFELAVPVGRLQ